MAEIRWEDPPGDVTPRRGRYIELQDALRANPGRWAVIDDDAVPTTITAMRTQKAWRGFEFTVRKVRYNDAGRRPRCTAYARYVGEREES